MEKLISFIFLLTIILIIGCGKSSNAPTNEENPVENLPNWSKVGSNENYQLNDENYEVRMSINFEVIISLYGQTNEIGGFDLVGLNGDFFYPGRVTQKISQDQDSVFITKEYKIECTETAPDINTMSINTPNENSYKASVDGIKKIIRYVRCN